MMQQYEIPVIWQMCGKINVEATSLDDAICKALKDSPLPKDQWYIDDSIILNIDDLSINTIDILNFK
ncbi:hypothetical protein [Clostridium sp.]|uniref:hypothetical protein n=1 Tax=Clostridium sp. TaxID=1506 RepID=UPI002FDD406B